MDNPAPQASQVAPSPQVTLSPNKPNPNNKYLIFSLLIVLVSAVILITWVYHIYFNKAMETVQTPSQSLSPAPINKSRLDNLVIGELVTYRLYGKINSINPTINADKKNGYNIVISSDDNQNISFFIPSDIQVQSGTDPKNDIGWVPSDLSQIKVSDKIVAFVLIKPTPKADQEINLEQKDLTASLIIKINEKNNP